MFQVIYKGPETELGRFGRVRAGQELRLTAKEVKDVKGDSRFKVKTQVIPTQRERLLELSEMNSGELLAFCHEAKKNRRPIEFRGTYTGTQLIQAILMMERTEADKKAASEKSEKDAKDAQATLKALVG